MATTRTMLFSLLLAGAAGAQELPFDDALRAALAQTELRHDDAAARDALRAVIADAATDGAVRRHAWLRLGELLLRTGDAAAAREALEAAGGADDEVAARAQRALRGAVQDPERLRELRARAEAAIERFVSEGTINASVRDVTWFGEVAAPLVVERFEEAFAEPWKNRAAIAGRLLWEVDGTDGYLAEILTAEDAGRREFAAQPLRYVSFPATGPKNALLRRYLRAPEPDVVAYALSRWSVVGVGDLLQVLERSELALRVQALQCIEQWFRTRATELGKDSPELAAASAAIAAALPPSLEAVDPDEFRAASNVLLVSGGFSPASRGLLFAWLPRLSRDGGPPVAALPDRPTFAGPNEHADLLGRALEELGPLPPRNATPAMHAAARAVMTYVYLEDGWDRGALPSVLQALRLGYVPTGTPWFGRHAHPDDAAALVDAAIGQEAMASIVQWLQQIDVPAGALDALERAVRSRLADELGYERQRRGRFAELTTGLLIAIGKSGAPEAVELLGALLAAEPLRENPIELAPALEHLAVRNDSAATRDLLRTCLLAAVRMQPSQRQRQNEVTKLFAQLVRLGDVEVWRHVAELEAVWTGANVNVVDPGDLLGGAAFDGVRNVSPGALAGWLACATVTPEGDLIWWHGYDDATAAALWSELLAPADGAPNEAAWGEPVVRLLERRDALPPEVTVAVADAHRRRLQSGSAPDDAFRRSLSLLVGGPSPTDEVDTALERLRETALQAPDPGCRRTVLVRLPTPLTAKWQRAVREHVADPDRDVARAAWDVLIEAGVPVDRALVAQGLQSPDGLTRQTAIGFARRATDDVADLIRARIGADPVPNVRVAACLHFTATHDLRAVPELLEALGDPDSGVRTAARQALDAIRFYHDEKAHWDRVFAGEVGLTAASAAEALLDQAKPGNDAATRVLAIRSLGVLGAPETLPFLITWTKDADPAIADAARAALTTIHTR